MVVRPRTIQIDMSFIMNEKISSKLMLTKTFYIEPHLVSQLTTILLWFQSKHTFIFKCLLSFRHFTSSYILSSYKKFFFFYCLHPLLSMLLLHSFEVGLKLPNISQQHIILQWVSPRWPPLSCGSPGLLYRWFNMRLSLNTAHTLLSLVTIMYTVIYSCFPVIKTP